jgi:hypothetical protein
MTAPTASTNTRPSGLSLVPSTDARGRIPSAVTHDVRAAVTTALSGRRPGAVAYLVIDVENMCLLGEGDAKYLDEDAFARLCGILTVIAGSSIHVLYGYSHHWAVPFRFELPGGRHLWRSGPDGGESTLIEALHHEGLPLGTESLIVLSGDHAFTDVVASVGATGISTSVVARAGTLARSLELAAHHSVTFTDGPDDLSDALDELAPTLAGGGRVVA